MNNQANWNEKGAALSDKTARKEYGLTQEEIIAGIKQGKLQFRQNHIHGNPYLRLLRSEVEALATKLRGKAKFDRQQLQTQLQSVHSEIRKLNAKLKQLQKQKHDLQTQLDD